MRAGSINKFSVLFFALSTLIPIQTAPAENQTLLKVIFHLLAEIAADSTVNKMNSDNLATCLAPTLFIGPSIKEDSDFLQRTQLVNKVAAFVIDWAWEIFDMTTLQSPLASASNKNVLDDGF